MITITIIRKNGRYTGFRSEGHAEYADEGYDIICAAVSVLTTNTANSIEALTSSEVKASGKKGMLTCQFPEGLDEKGELLVDSMVLGLKDIEAAYGSSYIRLRFEEV